MDEVNLVSIRTQGPSGARCATTWRFKGLRFWDDDVLKQTNVVAEAFLMLLGKTPKPLSYGNTAMIRAGPPLPSSIFSGIAMNVAPVAGRRSTFATFSNAGLFAALSTWWAMKSLLWP